MEELCTACLCTGRNLHFIGETGFYDLYSQILNEIPVYDTSQVCVRVCWECRALLRRLQRFKARVKTSYQLLMGLHESGASTIARAPRLAVHRQPAFSCPLAVDRVKDEAEIKVEAEHDEHDEHCEQTFVHDYNAEQEPLPILNTRSKQKPKKANQKKTIKKKTHTKKRRKKSISTEESDTFDHLDVSDVDSIHNDTKSNVMEGVSEDVIKEGGLEDEVIKEDEVEEAVLEKKVRQELRCVECGAQFEGESELIAHLESSHREVVSKPNGVAPPAPAPARAPRASSKDVVLAAGDKPQCTECGKVFSSRKTYRYHLNVLHKGQNKHQCPRCGKVYQWKSNLGRHIRSHKMVDMSRDDRSRRCRDDHGSDGARDAGELYCELCDKRFASVATYRQHLRVSRRHVTENEFSFVCTACGKKFVNKTRLQDHVDWEHLNKIKFQCQLCHKPFKCHTSLYVHMQNVHTNKEKKDNLCHVCGKSYQNAAKLKYHIVAMHTSETPYQCGDCHAAFGWYSSLYRHVREVHQKVKLQSSKAKKSKRKPPDMLPPPPPHPHS